MKSLITFIKESQTDVWNDIFYTFISGTEEEYGDEPEVKKFAEDFKKLANKFLKDNNITNINQLLLTTSSKDMMDEWFDGTNLEIKEDESLEDICSNGFMEDGDIYVEEGSSWRYKDNKLYFSSQTGAYMDGDYFDGCFSKK